MFMNNYSVFLNLTDACNFRCAYCYEKDCQKSNFMTMENAQKICDFLDSNKDMILKLKNQKIIRIHFFGGEPTLNPEVIEYIYNRLYKDEDYYFSLITNGYNISDIKNIFKKDRRIHLQISYDGYELQNINRKHKDNIETGNIVRNNILELLDLGYYTTVKSVVTPNYFSLMEDAYLDIMDIFSKINFKWGDYLPSIDYFNDYDDLEEYDENLKKAIIKISSHEIEFFKKYNRIFFGLFYQNGNKICGAGRNVIGIDTDLSVVPCEGGFQKSGINDHYIGNLLEEDIIDKIQKWGESLVIELPEECKKCDSTVCYKCNMVKYARSKKKTYNERWNDYANQPILCKYYKIIDKIKRAFWYMITEEKRR